MALITAKLDTTDVELRLSQLDRRLGRRSLARALNAGVKSMQILAINEIRRDLTIKKGDARKSLRFHRARMGQHSAEMTISAARVPLIRFSVKQVKSGLSVRIKKSGKRHRFRHAFIATTDSGHKGVFERNPKKQVPRVGPKYHGLRIRELHSTGPASVLRHRRVLRRVHAHGIRSFHKELKSQIDLVVKTGK
jgi:hypothetical protein